MKRVQKSGKKKNWVVHVAQYWEELEEGWSMKIHENKEESIPYLDFSEDLVT